MSLPEIVSEHLGDEEPVAEVALGGDDLLLVTPTRTLVYRAEGLLSDESVEELPHAVECITIENGRRKATLVLDYGIDGEKSITLPKGKLDEVLHPMLAGVLDAKGITEPGESVKRTFRFSELTLIVTSQRVVKHIGQPVWDEEFEEYPFEEVTDLAFEPGNVATSVVLTVSDHQERFKAPNDDARMVEAALKDAILTYYDVPDIEAFRALSADEDAEPADASSSSPFGDGPDLFGNDEDEQDDEADEEPDTDRIVEQVTNEEYYGAKGEGELDTASDSDPNTASTESDADLAAEVSALREEIERQRADLDRQSELIDQLIEELRVGR
ncbi:hypothetical protein [Halolamina sp.]|jgi:hypothetical protein|uniref:DUF7115 domain-containing protein n=1 Tax=Halolamina sp. TaxID=1940283 RepID=UPI0035620567